MQCQSIQSHSQPPNNSSTIESSPESDSSMASDHHNANDSPDSGTSRYLIVRPENGGIRDLFRFWISADKGSGAKFLESSDEGVFLEELLGLWGEDVLGGRDVTPNHRWVIVVSIVVRKMVAFFRKPMEWTGCFFEFFLNLLSENGNLLGLLYNLLRGKVVIPQRGSETFISTIGHLDGRIDLYKGDSFVDQIVNPDSGEGGLRVEIGNQALMDLCMMASKLAYENERVIRNVVDHHWKMHFVDFYNGWNDFQKEMSTQVYILRDKPKDANLILISFRGTEPFDADDWGTDFDYSWYEIPKVGKIHMGFLEALGLGNRADTSTFTNSLQAKDREFASSKGTEGLAKSEENTIPPEMVEKTAYFAVRRKLKSLLSEHSNAKFIVTGHSLGGALAILFPIVLVLHEERELLQRLMGVHTFGQPRVGNRQLGKFMEAHLDHPVRKYFRIVYCNDLVPRLPYDDKTFLYKHFGVCRYYDSLYIEHKVDEEPNRNYFGFWFLIPEYLNAFWELIRSLIMGYIFGPEYKEGWLTLLLRIVGLALPGISAHCPADYVNSVRLGKDSTIQMSSL